VHADRSCARKPAGKQQEDLAMTLSPRRSLPVVAASALVGLVLLGCSSSNSSKKTPTVPPPTVAASPAQTGAQQGATPAATAAVNIAPTLTATPAVQPSATSAAATAAPAATTAATAAATTAPTTATVAPAATSAPTSAGGAAAAISQSTLQNALLTASDLPAGFTGQGNFSSGANGSGNAAVSAFFIKPPQGSVGAQTVFITLTSFANQNNVSSAFNDLKNQATSRISGTSKIDPVSAPTVGDESVAYHLTAGTGAGATDGYIVVWRHGRVGSAIAFTTTGGGGPQDVNAAVALAQAQDSKLKNAGV
jgi:hypothetical protein